MIANFRRKTWIIKEKLNLINIDDYELISNPKSLSDSSSSISEPRSIERSKSSPKFSPKSDEKEEKISSESLKNNSISDESVKVFVDKSTDTDNLIDSVDILKAHFMNHLICWSFLEKMSQFYQWPLACIGNLVDNAIKKSRDHGVTVLIDYYIPDITLGSGYTSNLIDIPKNCNTNSDTNPNLNTNSNIYSNLNTITHTLTNINLQNSSFPILTIKDDGPGISKRKFNKIICLNSTDELKHNKIFEFGLTFRASLMRLADSVLIISKKKHYNEVNIGVLSKFLQKMVNTDYLVNPVINFKFNPKTLNLIPTSLYYNEILNIILNEIKVIFPNSTSLLDYIRTINTGNYMIINIEV